MSRFDDMSSEDTSPNKYEGEEILSDEKPSSARVESDALYGLRDTKIGALLAYEQGVREVKARREAESIRTSDSLICIVSILFGLSALAVNAVSIEILGIQTYLNNALFASLGIISILFSLGFGVYGLTRLLGSNQREKIFLHEEQEIAKLKMHADYVSATYKLQKENSNPHRITK